MSKSSRDQSINSEPHLQSGGWKKDPSERDAEVKVDRETVQENVDDRVHHSVWNEPGVSPVLSGSPPEDALTFANWLEERRSQTGFLDSWALVFCWAFVAGPLAILGTLLGALTNFTFLIPLQIVLIGPIAEELMKIAIPLWVVERRPYLFRSRFQIFYLRFSRRGSVRRRRKRDVLRSSHSRLDESTDPLALDNLRCPAHFLLSHFSIRTSTHLEENDGWQNGSNHSTRRPLLHDSNSRSRNLQRIRHGV